MEQFSQFGWDMEDYKEQVLYYAVLQRKLSEAAKVLPEGETGIEEVQARHILLLTSPETATSSVQAAAQAALDRVKGGEDFAAVATELSEDPGSATNGGDLGWFARGVMVPEFEEAVFALEPGKITENLVQTSYGFHIIKSEGKRQARDVEAYFSEVFDSAEIEMTLDIANPFAQPELVQPQGDVVPEGTTELQ
jgi:peptidyl-prolyl cis-trans isomerase D